MIEIGFAHKSFKWTNNAKKNAGVSCVIIGLRNYSKEKKIIFSDQHRQLVPNITPYLTAGPTIYISRKSKPLSNLPEMTYGNYTGGCGALILSKSEMIDLVKKYPRAKKFIRKFVGSDEFINGIDRFCLWIRENELEDAREIVEINNRIETVKQERQKSIDPSIQKLALRPHQFRDMNEINKTAIIIPIVSSEKREYIPCGFL